MGDTHAALMMTPLYLYVTYLCFKCPAYGRRRHARHARPA